jgi:hypothetical protein
LVPIAIGMEGLNGTQNAAIPLKTIMAHKQEPEKDRHLSAPGEANRDKHINFVALEQGDPDPSMEDDSTTKQKDKESKEERTNEES